MESMLIGALIGAGISAARALPLLLPPYQRSGQTIAAAARAGSAAIRTAQGR